MPPLGDVMHKAASAHEETHVCPPIARQTYANLPGMLRIDLAKTQRIWQTLRLLFFIAGFVSGIDILNTLKTIAFASKFFFHG